MYQELNNYVEELIDEEINDVAVSNLNKTTKKEINTQNEEQLNELDNSNSSNELTELEEVDCLICLEPIENYTPGFLICGCNNKFHLSCLQSWISQNYNCPICRKGPNIQSDNRNSNDHVVEFMNYFENNNNNRIIPIENYEATHRRMEINRLQNSRRNQMKFFQLIMLIIVFIIIIYSMSEGYLVSNNDK